MSIQKSITDLYDALKEHGMELRQLEIYNLQSMVDKECLIYNSVGDVVIRHCGRDISLKEYGWRLNYNHDPEMSAEYFFRWRPAFKALKDKCLSDPVIAEVGVFEGFLTDKVKKHLSFGKYHLVDPWKEYNDHLGSMNFPQEIWDSVYRTVCERFTGDKFVIHRKPSVEAAKEVEDGSLDFVYIDGDHRKSEVLADIRAWYPKVKTGGIISGHDFVEKEVYSGVFQFIYDHAIKNNADALGVYQGYNDWWFFKD